MAPTASSLSNRPRHGKAFASHPHIDGNTIVHDISQAVNPRRNLPSPTLLCSTEQNRPRRPIDGRRSSASHRRHKRPQHRCTAAKTPVGAAGGYLCADKGLLQLPPLQHQTPTSVTRARPCPASPASRSRPLPVQGLHCTDAPCRMRRTGLHAAGRASTCRTGLRHRRPHIHAPSPASTPPAAPLRAEPASRCRPRLHAAEPASTLHVSHPTPRRRAGLHAPRATPASTPSRQADLNSAGRISTGCAGLHTAGLASMLLHAPPPPEPRLLCSRHPPPLLHLAPDPAMADADPVMPEVTNSVAAAFTTVPTPRRQSLPPPAAANPATTSTCRRRPRALTMAPLRLASTLRSARAGSRVAAATSLAAAILESCWFSRPFAQAAARQRGGGRTAVAVAVAWVAARVAQAGGDAGVLH
uniref:Uncharacterized protein n=1 Tax=Oryza glumipatula TaxID=40148 RepID=A0A0E0B8N9_9ORYZ